MESTTPKPFAFVVMPFTKQFDDVYKLGIKAACAEAGTYCERLDEQIFEEGMLDRIYNQIAKADIIVADMSGQNPNVFYEVGYAHALGKRVILVTNDASDIPFDLKHRFHIVYEGSISRLKQTLLERVAWYVANPGDRKLEVADLLELQLDGKPLKEWGQYTATCEYYSPDFYWEIDIAAHNPSTEASVTISPGIIVPEDINELVGSSENRMSSIRLSDGRWLHQFEAPVSIQAAGWRRMAFVIGSSKALQFGRPIPVILRLLAGGAPKEIPFTVTLDDYRQA